MADIISVALAEVGKSDSVESPNGSNHIKYNDWYYYEVLKWSRSRVISGKDYPWCAVFISWCADRAGIPATIIPRTASSSAFRSFFKEKYLFREKGKYTPKAGDIMLMDGHVGIVVSVGTSNFQTVEGNAGNRVQRLTRSFTDSRILGYGLPQYGQTVAPNTGYVVDAQNAYGVNSGQDLGVGTYKYTRYAVQDGDTLDSIAAKFGTTLALITFINDLPNDQIKKGDALNVPTPLTSSDANDNASSNANITRKHTISYDVYKPTLTVAFFGEYGKLAAVTTETVADSGVAKDVVSINTSRSLAQDCATFSITLVYRNDWYNAISSNDLVVIRMQRPPEAMRTVFYGLVDDIRNTLDFSSGQPQRVITITGRGFNKAFINFNVGFIKAISIDTDTGFFDGLMDLTTCNSYMAIKKTLEAYVGKAINYKFGNGKTFPFYFRYAGNERPGESLVDYTSFTTYSGSLWNFIKELGNAPFCETFWECIDEKPTLYHRRTPFNRKDWNELPLIVIPDSSLVSYHIGRSDLETYTVFAVQQEALGDDFTNIYRPLWYPPHYSKYGITQLEVSTIYDVALTGNPEATARQYFIDLFNWNIKNALMANGTLLVKGSNQYTIGSRVVLESSGMEFYVEGVSQIFNCYDSWMTELQVTRGLLTTQRFTAPWGAYEEMTDSVMSAIVQQTSGADIDWANLPKVTPKANTPVDVPEADVSEQQYVSNNNIPTDGKTSGGKSWLIKKGYGTIWTYMGWSCITARSSNQYKLREQAGERYDSNGFGRINNRYVIACTSTFGKIGDYLTVKLTNGQVFYCIIGDEKNQSDPGCNEYGHNNGKSIIEFVVNKNLWYGTGRTVLKCHPEWKSASIASIVNTGNYWG